jgi:hypothetical protein
MPPAFLSQAFEGATGRFNRSRLRQSKPHRSPIALGRTYAATRRGQSPDRPRGSLKTEITSLSTSYPKAPGSWRYLNFFFQVSQISLRYRTAGTTKVEKIALWHRKYLLAILYVLSTLEFERLSDIPYISQKTLISCSDISWNFKAFRKNLN